jgi:menaquinone-dependent protoporphyrinogen IX oxidase
MAKPPRSHDIREQDEFYQEIAEAIGRQLQISGMQVTVAPCKDRVSSEGFDGVIIGSAIYTRRWMNAATRFLKRYADREWDRIRGWASDIAHHIEQTTVGGH